MKKQNILQSEEADDWPCLDAILLSINTIRSATAFFILSQAS